VNYGWDVLDSDVHGEVWLLGCFVLDIDADKALDGAISCSRIHSPSVCALTMFERRGYVDKEEVSPCTGTGHDGVLDKCSRAFLGSHRGSDDSSASPCQLTRNESNVAGYRVALPGKATWDSDRP